MAEATREELEADLTLLEKTTEILKEVMNGICGWLVLTMEMELMFNGTLPTLDLQIWVNESNKILYKYYEKPTTPITVLHARSAIPEATIRATLNQEMIRRMTNTSELVDEESRIIIVDEYAQKLINSEYGFEMTRGFIIGGLKGYERLLSLSRDTGNPRWKPLHLAANWNSKNRRTAKMLSKTNWFKGKAVVNHHHPTRRESLTMPHAVVRMKTMPTSTSREGTTTPPPTTRGVSKVLQWYSNEPYPHHQQPLGE